MAPGLVNPSLYHLCSKLWMGLPFPVVSHTFWKRETTPLVSGANMNCIAYGTCGNYGKKSKLYVVYTADFDARNKKNNLVERISNVFNIFFEKNWFSGFLQHFSKILYEKTDCTYAE